ncbi:uncharacterized protein LOC144914622 [Branchiostoma floridae x Branchiostoma belcheri]
MTTLKLLVLLAPLFLVGAGWASADNLEKTPVDELRERGFQVSEGCASHKHGDQWASTTKGLNCACARRRSLCYSVTCLPDTHLAVVKGRWSCVFDDDKKHNDDPRSDVKTALPQETRMNAHLKETGNGNLRLFRNGVTGLDIFNTIFALMTFVLGTSSDQQYQQQIIDKLEDLEQQLDQLSAAISNLQAQVQAGNQWTEGVILYGRAQQRLRYLLHYLNERLSLDANGQLQPAYQAEEWADSVLSFSSDGVDEILFHLHDMMMGTMSVFGYRPLILVYEARMDASSSRYWGKVNDLLEYVYSLEVAGNAAIATALNLKGRSSETPTRLQEGRRMIEREDNFLRPYVTKWPTGTYGLPMTNTGCPANTQVAWYTGHRNQDAEDSAGLNSWSTGLHFPTNTYSEGHTIPTYAGGHMVQNFCMKTSIYEGSGSWPRGRYCIFKYRTCPSGFQSGYVYWDDEDPPGNHNTVSGTRPDGVYDINTKIYYCCRSDGFTLNPIILPAHRPFYLFRHSSSRCQRVQNMQVTQEYFLWDDENYNNQDTTWGSHPDDTGDGRNHKLWYCYYEPTV